MFDAYCNMKAIKVISPVVALVVVICYADSVRGGPVGTSYGPPPKQEETEVEIIKVEVYEVPWIGDAPQDTYGPPADSYGPPIQPEITTTEEPISLTTTLSPVNTTNTNTTVQSERLENIQGHYYIYHPSGQLQKITYLTQNDDKDMTFSAQLKYKDVEPVRGPIYTYDPQTYVFSRLNR